MIRLIMRDGTAYWLNPDKLVEVYTENTGDTIIRTTQGETVVTESPEQVVKKVMDYKLAMVSYRAWAQAYAAEKDGEQATFMYDEAADMNMSLRKLAGLEVDHE